VACLDKVSSVQETIDLLLEWAQQKLFEHPTGAIPAGNRGNSVLMTNLPAVDIRIMRLDALEFYLYNFLFMPSAPTDGTGIGRFRCNELGTLLRRANFCQNCRSGGFDKGAHRMEAQLSD
jgi:hypothetical protein